MFFSEFVLRSGRGLEQKSEQVVVCLCGVGRVRTRTGSGVVWGAERRFLKACGLKTRMKSSFILLFIIKPSFTLYLVVEMYNVLKTGSIDMQFIF